MEKLSHRIADKIGSELNYDQEKIAVMAYGLTAMIQTVSTVVTVAVIGYILGCMAESIIVCITVGIMRKSTGGAHASSIGVCFAVSIVATVVLAYIARFVLLPNFAIAENIGLSIAVFILSVVIVYKNVPVDCPNKPIKSKEKIKYLRKKSFVNLILAAAISSVLIGMSYYNPIFASFNYSLQLALCWQSLTLIPLKKIQNK